MNYTRVIFISYSSPNRDQAKALVDRLRGLGYFVQFEEKSTTGDSRWSLIFEQIRTSDVILMMVGNQTVTSDARMLEYQYARDLERPVLGIQLASFPEAERANLPEFNAFLDYRRQNDSQFTDIADALDALPQQISRSPNIPLPSTSAALDAISERLSNASSQPLDEAEQQIIIRTLRDFIERQETRTTATALLEKVTRLGGVAPEARREASGLLNRAPIGMPTVVAQNPVMRMSRRNRILLNAGASLFLLAILAALIFIARSQNAALQRANPTSVAVRSVELTETRDARFALEQTSTAAAQSQQTATARFATNLANATNNALITQTAIAAYTDTPTPSATFTDTATATNTPEPTATFTDTATFTATFTLTPTATFTATNTATNTSTNTPTATATATFTSTSTLTNTVVPSATSTNTAVVTNTAPPAPTNTNVPRSTSTPRPTDTATVPPTATTPPTSTSRPTTPPTATITDTPFPILTATSTPRPASPTPAVTATQTTVPATTAAPLVTSTPRPEVVLPQTVFIGIIVEDTSAGVRVTSVGTTASNAGVQVGDIVVAVDLEEVETIDEFAEIMNASNPFTDVTFRLRRNGIVLIPVTLSINDFDSVTPTPMP